MIFVLTGNDQQKKNKEVNMLVEKHGGHTMFLSMSYSENEEEGLLQKMIHSEDLFGKPLLLQVHVDSVKKIIDILKNPLTRFSNSNDICVLHTSSLTKQETLFFEKCNATIKDYTIVKKKESPLVFALSDALIKKDKKNAWILFQNCIKNNISAEEIHGTLWWQYKTLSLISGKEKSLAKKSISPYVYSKSEAALKNFKEENILESLECLMNIFQESRRGSKDLFHQLELFILTQ